MMMKKSWKNRSGVSPVIATILMVAITVVLAAVLYVMVMGFNNGGSQTPNVSLSSRATTGNNYEVYVLSVSGGKIAYANVEAVVVSGPATTTGTITAVGSTHTDLAAGDKAAVVSSAAGSVTVMFKDKVSGASLGQLTFNVAYTAPST